MRILNSPRFPFPLYWRLFNHWPALRGTGMRVTYVAPDWTELRLKLKLGRRTRNYVGTIFGAFRVARRRHITMGFIALTI